MAAARLGEMLVKASLIDEDQLKKALEVLSAIDLETFKPSDASVQKLKEDILNEDAGNRWWLKDRVFS